MLVERLLSRGGCNYGNTVVLGQELRPHVQPTGLAMLALAGQADSDGRIARSLDFLSANLSVETTSASLSYGLIGLAAHDRFPANASKWLQAAYRRTIARDGAAYKLALLSLAARAPNVPWSHCRQKPKNRHDPFNFAFEDSHDTTNVNFRLPTNTHRHRQFAEQFRPPRIACRRRHGAGRLVCLSDDPPAVRSESVGIHRTRPAIRRPAGANDSRRSAGFADCSRRILSGKRVLLKPNLVEPNRKVPQMTTNPAMILAAATVFRRWGASVVVGEGPGHVRDTEMALVESGVQDGARRRRAGIRRSEL